MISSIFMMLLQQPTPIVCSSCNSKGHIECKWCAGTGFFIIGDNMLCEVPSRNTSCIICTGKVHLFWKINLNSLHLYCCPPPSIVLPYTYSVVNLLLFRDQLAARIVKEQAFVQSGWKNLLHPSRKTLLKGWNIAFKSWELKLYYTSF